MASFFRTVTKWLWFDKIAIKLAISSSVVPFHSVWLSVIVHVCAFVLQTYSQWPMRSPSIGAVLFTMSWITVWARPSRHLLLACWWMASLTPPIIAAASAWACSQMSIATPPLRTHGATLAKVQLKAWMGHVTVCGAAESTGLYFY